MCGGRKETHREIESDAASRWNRNPSLNQIRTGTGWRRCAHHSVRMQRKKLFKQRWFEARIVSLPLRSIPPIPIGPPSCVTRSRHPLLPDCHPKPAAKDLSPLAGTHPKPTTPEVSDLLRRNDISPDMVNQEVDHFLQSFLRKAQWRGVNPSRKVAMGEGSERVCLNPRLGQ